MTMKTPLGKNPFAKVKTAVGRCLQVRDERDAALKTAAAALAELDAMAESDTAIEADVNAAEIEFEKKVEAFVELNKTLSAACDTVLSESYLGVLTLTMPKNMAKA